MGQFQNHLIIIGSFNLVDCRWKQGFAMHGTKATEVGETVWCLPFFKPKSPATSKFVVHNTLLYLYISFLAQCLHFFSSNLESNNVLIIILFHRIIRDANYLNCQPGANSKFSSTNYNVVKWLDSFKRLCWSLSVKNVVAHNEHSKVLLWRLIQMVGNLSGKYTRLE